MKRFPETLTSALEQAAPAVHPAPSLSAAIMRPSSSAVWNSVRTASQDIQDRQTALRASALRAPR